MIKTHPILYSFRRCPYAMRARLAICISKVVCELREVVLRDKPASMLELSPKGTVPVLQDINNNVIDESLDVMLWALQQSDPQGWLTPSMDEMMALIQINDGEFKNHLDRYKYANRYEDVDEIEERTKAECFLALLEERLSCNAFLFGPKPSLADYAILPFVRQFAFVDKVWFDRTDYKHVQHWLQGFLISDIFKSVMVKHTPWKEGDAPVLFP